VHDERTLEVRVRDESDAVGLDDGSSDVVRDFAAAPDRFSEGSNQQVTREDFMLPERLEVFMRDV
jgi:hypothetical protein